MLSPVLGVQTAICLHIGTFCLFHVAAHCVLSYLSISYFGVNQREVLYFFHWSTDSSGFSLLLFSTNSFILHSIVFLHELSSPRTVVLCQTCRVLTSTDLELLLMPSRIFIKHYHQQGRQKANHNSLSKIINFMSI